MNTKLASLLLAVLALALPACTSNPNARGTVKGHADIQGFDGDTPVTSPYSIDGSIKYKLQTKKPILTIEVLDPATVVHTQTVGGPARVEGSGLTDDGNTLIIRK